MFTPPTPPRTPGREGGATVSEGSGPVPAQTEERTSVVVSSAPSTVQSNSFSMSTSTTGQSLASNVRNLPGFHAQHLRPSARHDGVTSHERSSIPSAKLSISATSLMRRSVLSRPRASHLVTAPMMNSTTNAPFVTVGSQPPPSSLSRTLAGPNTTTTTITATPTAPNAPSSAHSMAHSTTHGSTVTGPNYGSVAFANATTNNGVSGSANVNTTPGLHAFLSATSAQPVFTVHVDGDEGGVEMRAAYPRLQRALVMRDRYKGLDHGRAEVIGLEERLQPPITLQLEDGVFRFGEQRTVQLPWEQYYDDLCALEEIVQQPACIAACGFRLQVLEEKYHIFKLCNAREMAEQVERHGRGTLLLGAAGPNTTTTSNASVTGAATSAAGAGVTAAAAAAAASATANANSGSLATGGVATASNAVGGVAVTSGAMVSAEPCRVDGFVELTTMMNAQWLTRYMQRTLLTCADEEVALVSDVEAMGNGAAMRVPQSLQRFCEVRDLAPQQQSLTIDVLGLRPSLEKPHSYFDILDAAMSQGVPGSTELLRLFLTRETLNNGAFLAEAVRPCLLRLHDRDDGTGAASVMMMNALPGPSMSLDPTLINNNNNTNSEEMMSQEMNYYAATAGNANSNTNNGAASSNVGGVMMMNNSNYYYYNNNNNGNGAMLMSNEACEVVVELDGLQQEEWERLALWLREQELTNCAGSRQRWWIALNPHKTRRVSGMNNNGAEGNASGGDASPYTTNANGARGAAVLDNHQQYFDHVFLPLFLATISPEDGRCSEVAALLEQVGGFVFVPSEEGSAQETVFQRGRRRPADVPWVEQVSDRYMMYYVWANLCSLNALRRRRGLHTLQLRSLAGSAPSRSHRDLLLSSYLVCDSIIDGLALDTQPVLQYLYGLHRIGVHMCPLRDNCLGNVAYVDHPFPRLFRRGLRVTLCTVSPLLFHDSADPLMEEYGVAEKLFRLSRIDLRELAFHSVLLSSFASELKAQWLQLPPQFTLGTTSTTSTAAAANVSGAGGLMMMGGGNDWLYNDSANFAARWMFYEQQGCVPVARLRLREEMWAAEHDILRRHAEYEAQLTQVVPAGSPNHTNERSLSVLHTPATITTGDAAGHRAPLVSAEAAERDKASPSTITQQQSILPPIASSPTALVMRGRAPYVVLDPHVHYPRVVLLGPYDRDMRDAAVAQALHRALELRRGYVRSYGPHAQALAWISTLAAASPNTLAENNNNGNVMQGNGRASLLAGGGTLSLGQKTQAKPQRTVQHAFARDKARDAFDEDEWMFKTVEGIVVPHEVHQIPRLPQSMSHYDDFRQHVQEIRALMNNLHVRNFASRRLQLLEHRFRLHVAVNHGLEAGTTEARASQNRDFYQSTKVDNNVRMETGMTARQLLDFIIAKAQHSGDDIVSHPSGKGPQTLRQLLAALQIAPDTLTVDDLNVQVNPTLQTTSAQYLPEGRDALLTLLLKTDNEMNGRYFAELTKLTFENMKRDRFTFTESRLPIYGASAEEWNLLSTWFDTHGMASSHNQWIIQIPRIYGHLRRCGKVQSFAHYLENIFKPLWNVSLHPNKEPRLFHFVDHIAGFDCVEDEMRPDIPLSAATKPPHEWTSAEDPPYNYYLYHLWANIFTLNEFRQRRQFSTFVFRPSCGEAGSVEHLIGGFLLGHHVAYGVQLRVNDPLQYLFYLAQIGVTVSPLSNNTKVLDYLANPFPHFFRRGLRVTLGTDSPLMYHHTQEPLLEEYSIASKIWKLSPNDLCELARNSVLLSGFSPAFKQDRLGDYYFLSSSQGNDAAHTHLSNARVAYRFETYHNEVGFLEYIAGQPFPKAMLTLQEEEQHQQDYDAQRTRLQAMRATATLHGNIIDAAPHEADLARLEAQREFMSKQVQELTNTVAGLQKQNRQLTDKLAEERERDQQAAQLRRRRMREQQQAQQHHNTTYSQPNEEGGEVMNEVEHTAEEEDDEGQHPLYAGSRARRAHSGSAIGLPAVALRQGFDALSIHTRPYSGERTEEAVTTAQSSMSLGGSQGAAYANGEPHKESSEADDEKEEQGEDEDDERMKGSGLTAEDTATRRSTSRPVSGTSQRSRAHTSQNTALLGRAETLWTSSSRATR